MTFPFCEIIGKKLRSIGVGRRREIFVWEIENVEERRPEDEEEKRTPEFERVEKEENGGSKGRKGGGREKEGEVDEAKSANVTCLFFTIEAHCS